MYQKTGQLNEAEDESNYITYKRMAVLEIDIQGAKANENRNYSQFEEYYNKTMELYEKANVEANDVEIQRLQQAYSQLLIGKWLEK